MEKNGNEKKPKKTEETKETEAYEKNGEPPSLISSYNQSPPLNAGGFEHIYLIKFGKPLSMSLNQIVTQGDDVIQG